jgi:hypothetical protein
MFACYGWFKYVKTGWMYSYSCCESDYDEMRGREKGYPVPEEQVYMDDATRGVQDKRKLK